MEPRTGVIRMHLQHLRRVSRVSRPARRVVALGLVAALAVAACGPSAAAINDPVEILQKGAASLGDLHTVHLRGTVDGDLTLDLGSLTGAGSSVPVSVTGTTLEGDVDVASVAVALELLVPSVLNVRANLVVLDGTAYLKAPLLTGDSWVHESAGDSLASDLSGAFHGLAEYVTRPGLGQVKLTDARCAATDCYRASFNVPADEITVALQSLTSTIPGLSAATVGDAVVTFGVRKSDLRLATVTIALPVGGTTPLEIALELTKYDQPVTIAAPPADQVTSTPGA